MNNQLTFDFFSVKEEINNDFVAFILTHGRPDNVITFRTLKRSGYTGRIILIVDNEDKTIDKYIANFGVENVFIFDKKAMADKVDEANNFDNRKVILHARNYCFELAKKLNIKYFIQLDDDYGSFIFRFSDEKSKVIKNLDKVFNDFLEFYKKTNITTIAFSQGGDHIGGFNPKPKRKAMNSFFCSTDREFQFIGSINEDVNTYTTLGSRGEIFLTVAHIQLSQAATQSQNDGITDWYKLFGTYCKSFTTVLMQPSSVVVSMMSAKNMRLHHLIDWKSTTPMIIDRKYKK